MANLNGTTRKKYLDKEIGTRIKTMREKLGMSQETLADKLGVTFQQIQKYEYGINAIASTRVLDLCKALRIKPNDLFGV